MPIQCITTPVTRFTATCKALIFSHATRKRDSPLQPACYTCTHWQHCFVTSTFNSPRRSIPLPYMYMGRRTFTVVCPMFNAPEWPFRMDWALESPILIGLCIQCWNQNKLALERLSAFNKSASNITHSTITAQKLACVGIRFTVQCENSA